jgi:hypothetical protein
VSVESNNNNDLTVTSNSNSTNLHVNTYNYEQANQPLRWHLNSVLCLCMTVSAVLGTYENTRPMHCKLSQDPLHVWAIREAWSILLVAAFIDIHRSQLTQNQILGCHGHDYDKN